MANEITKLAKKLKQDIKNALDGYSLKKLVEIAIYLGLKVPAKIMNKINN